MKKLLNNSALENSSIVANSLMNRERKCSGGNSYEKELSCDILDFLKTRLQTEKQTAWLDICCGRGNALIEAATILNKQNPASNLKIVGVDLAGMFQSFPPELNFLKLIETAFEDYKTDTLFDLITCVHGLHYIGDKLAFLQKAISMLKPDGVFFANLDFANFKFSGGNSANRKIAKSLRNNGFRYDSKKHLLICKGKKEIEFDFQYLGADDGAGANYTKQAVVDSYYRERS
jgi:ubiquinone/menaquinone biosynthesis C-methylase UbiE